MSAPTRPTRVDRSRLTVNSPWVVHRSCRHGRGASVRRQARRVVVLTLRAVLDLVLPASCVGCGTEGVTWCATLCPAARRTGAAVPPRPLPGVAAPDLGGHGVRRTGARRPPRAQGARRSGVEPTAGGGPARRPSPLPPPAAAAARCCWCRRPPGRPPSASAATTRRCGSRGRRPGRCGATVPTPGSLRCCGCPGAPATRPASGCWPGAENLAGAVRVPPRRAAAVAGRPAGARRRRGDHGGDAGRVGAGTAGGGSLGRRGRGGGCHRPPWDRAVLGHRQGLAFRHGTRPGPWLRRTARPSRGSGPASRCQPQAKRST